MAAHDTRPGYNSRVSSGTWAGNKYATMVVNSNALRAFGSFVKYLLLSSLLLLLELLESFKAVVHNIDFQY